MDKGYFGYIDGIKNGVISGWAVGPDRAGPTKVVLAVNGEVVMEREASIFREGVKNSGFHETGCCGFSIKLPAKCYVDGGVQVRVFAEDRETQLTNSPIIIQRPGHDVDDSLKIFFMHIAKTAGTSVNKVLSSFFEETRCATHIEVMDWKKDDFLSRYDFVSGHIRIKEFIHFQNISAFKLVTILRDPIAQLGSHFCWLKYVAQNRQGRFFNTHPQPIRDACLRMLNVDFSSVDQLSKFVSEMQGVEKILFDNCQTRYLINDYNCLSVGDEALDEAISTTSLFSTIGFSDNLAAFYRDIGLTADPIKEVRDNVQKERYGLDVSDSNVREILFPLVKYDNLLIDHVKKNR